MIPKNTRRVTIQLDLAADAHLKTLNKRYFKSDKTTDVISFNLNENLPDGIFLLGEVVVSWPQIQKQAKIYKVPMAEELARVVTHGVLHLMGYEDIKTEQKKLMRKTEDRVLKRIKSPDNKPHRGIKSKQEIIP